MRLACAAILVLLCTGSSSAQPTNPSRHPLIDMESITQGVHAARMEVQVALADPAKAFEHYLARFQAAAAPIGHTVPGGPSDSRNKAERLAIFTSNLQKAAARNAASSSTVLAYGITPFMHLEQEEYERLYLGAADPQAAAAAAEALPEVTWTADEGVASRKLLGHTQAPALPALPLTTAPAPPAAEPLRSPSQTPNTAGGDRSSSDSSDDGVIEVAAPPTRAAPGTAAPPAQRLPAPRPRPAAAVSKGPGALPTLPYNPEFGASGCKAQRSYPFSEVVPPSEGVDWVLAGGTTPVKDQGLCGSCVAFATTALAEHMHMRKYGTTNTSTDLSEQDLLDCTLGDGCQGQYQAAYVDLIGCSGIALEADRPYRAADGGADLCQPHRRFSGMSHGQGGGWAAFINSPDTLAQAVSQAPTMVTLDATDWALYAGGILGCDTPGKTMNHAVAVVGYFNGVPQPTGELWDMFLVRNSFGRWWGGGNGPSYAGHVLIRKGCNATDGATGGPSGLHMSEGAVPLYG